MYFEEFGKDQSFTVVMLHGAFFTNTFGRQYVLQDRYHLVVPHLMGFGREAGKTFETENQIQGLLKFCRRFDKPALVGFSLGAQLAFRLISEAPGFFSSAVVVSPWLVDKDAVPREMMERNLTMYRNLQNKTKCGMIALMNGMPRNQRRDFVDSMQKVSETTVRNAVDTGISFKTVPCYKDADFPILAIAGAREPEDIRESVRQMAEKNPRCTCEIWKGAAHNIPPKFHRRFNERLIEFIG